jgi:hypothetical protein
MFPSRRIYPHVIAIDIAAIIIVAVIRFFKAAPVRFDYLVPLHRTIFIIPGSIVLENDYLAGADGYFFTGKAG